MKNATLSPMMLDTLKAILAHEDRGFIGADPDRYPTRTIVALTKRAMIQPNVDGSVRLTRKARTSLGCFLCPTLSACLADGTCPGLKTNAC